MKKTNIYWFALTSLLILNACGANNSITLSTPVVAASSPSTSLPTPLPTETLTATPLPTATPVLNPLQIEAMRAREYPGSDIVVEQVLDPGVNYSRYYVSYLSDGLKIYALMTVPNGEKPATGWPAIIFNHGYIPPNV